MKCVQAWWMRASGRWGHGIDCSRRTRTASWSKIFLMVLLARLSTSCQLQRPKVLHLSGEAPSSSSFFLFGRVVCVCGAPIGRANTNCSRSRTPIGHERCPIERQTPGVSQAGQKPAIQRPHNKELSVQKTRLSFAQGPDRDHPPVAKLSPRLRSV